MVDCLLEGMGGIASLGADYSGAWVNPWTFVITVVPRPNQTTDRPNPNQAFGATQRYPVLNLSRALGLEQHSSLAGRTVQWGGGIGELTYFWDAYDSVPAAYYADTPGELCPPAG